MTKQILKRLPILFFLLLTLSVAMGKEEIITVTAMAYCYTGNRTCSGAYPFPGTVAADHNIFPIGTILWIEGYGYGVVLDSGSAINGKIIDLYFHTEKEALKWGRRKVKVKILRRI